MSRSTGHGVDEAMEVIAKTYMVEEGYKLLLLSGLIDTGNGDSGAATIYLGHVPYSDWRVVGAGFTVTTSGTTTKKQIVSIGNLICDMGAADIDSFIEITQSITGGKDWTAGDVIFHVHKEVMGMEEGRVDEIDYACQAEDAEAAAGATVIREGAQFGRLQTKHAYLSCTMLGEATSAATVIPFVLLEVKDLNRI